jgi:hypothetical protein
MKNLLRFFMILILVAVILMPAKVASANATRIDFTNTETCDDDITIVREWGSGPNYHARGITQTCHDTSDFPFAAGTVYLTDGVLNCDANTCNMSGWSRFVTNEGGVWFGHWSLSAGVFEYRAHGGGMYEGQQFFVMENFNSGLNEKYILIPGG